MIRQARNKKFSQQRTLWSLNLGREQIIFILDCMDPEQKQDGGEMVDDDDLDDLDDLGLFHKSSLKNNEEPPLPAIVNEVLNVKRYADQNNQMKVKEYTEITKLGSGAFAEVKKVSMGNQYYAMKVYSLQRLKGQKFYAADGSFANSEQMFRNELDILKRLSHPNLAHCHQILYGGGYAYVVMELCDLGQIMDWSEQKNNFIRNPKVVQYISNKYKVSALSDVTRIIFLQAAIGLQYLHKHNISNRDIKVDNMLCRTTEAQGVDIKISDFTTVRYSQDDISYFTCGTAGFRGPEIQSATSDGYSCKALDVWSLGISLYTYFCEDFPFMGESDYAIELRVEKESLNLLEEYPSWFKLAISGMTAKSWKDRITIDQVVAILSAENP